MYTLKRKKKEWLGNFVVHVNVTECIQDFNNMYAVVQLASNSPHSSCLGLMSARDAGVRHAPPRPALIFLSRSVLRYSAVTTSCHSFLSLKMTSLIFTMVPHAPGIAVHMLLSYDRQRSRFVSLC